MAKSAIPSQEDEFSAYATQFTSVVADHPEQYRLTPEEVTTLKQRLGVWDQDLAAAVAARDSAKAAQQSKVLARAELEAILRDLGRRIQADSNVSNAARVQAGLPVHKTSRTPAPLPKEAPVGRVEMAGPLQHLIHFSADTHRGKPEGVIGCRIRVFVGENAPKNPADYVFVTQTGRSPFRMTHNEADSGKVAHYLLQWVNSREEVGPWSAVVSATVPAI
ncbi:MAG: hypothetical protein R3C49_12730 [Planctomycetaceae bacterium]